MPGYDRSVPTDPRDPEAREILREGDFRLWWDLVRRQWLVGATVFALVAGSVTAAAALWPWKYESRAKFLVRNAREDLLVTPNDTSAGLFRQDVSEETLNSEIELIRSRDILQRVVRDANLVASVRGEDIAVATERAVDALQESLAVGPIRRTNLIQVAYSARDPILAADVLRRLADSYLALHLSVHSSPGTYGLFTEQADRWRKELDAAEAAVTTLAGRENLVAPEEQRRGALESERTMEAELVAVEAQVREQAARLTAAQNALAGTDPRITTERRRLPNQGSVERAHTMIAELRNKRTELLTKFRTDDRLVLEVDEQLANTEQALKNATSMTATEEATDVNPAWRALEAERQSAALSLEGLLSRSQRLKAQVATYRARAVGLAEATPQYDTLIRQITEAREQYAAYQRRAEEARLSEALDRQRISNVVLAESPVPALRPSRPRTAIVLLLAAMAGGIAGLCAAVMTDRLRAGAARDTRTALLPPSADVSEA